MEGRLSDSDFEDKKDRKKKVKTKPLSDDILCQLRTTGSVMEDLKDDKVIGDKCR